VKIGAGVLAVGRRKNQKTSPLDAFSHIWGQRGDNRIVMKFCLGVGVPDVITRANFGNDRFGICEGAGVEFPPFLLTCVVVLKTLCHYRASVLV